MIGQLVLNLLTGAGTGYITNNIAIKMLFKKYFGRFGGIIEDTHDEFVENIAKLIEKDLINHNTLKDEFQSDNFRHYIKELIKDMFTHSLVENSIDLKNLKGIHESIENLITFLDKNQIYRKELKKNIATKPLKDALSLTQLNHISEPIANVIDIQKEEYINSLMNAIKEFKVDELVTPELLLQLNKNINAIIYNLDISKFNNSIDSFLDNLFFNIDIEEILNFTSIEIENIYFKQIFSNNKNSSSELISKLIEIATSNEGQIAIKESVNAVLEIVSKIDISILSLLDEEIKEHIKSFIKRELPKIINKIIEFMNQNEKDLEDLINNSIDKALDGGIFPELKKKIVSIFYTNIVTDFKVLSMVKDYIYEYKDRVEEEIVVQVIDILENKSIGELYQVIAEKKIITPEKVFSLILHNLQKVDIAKEIHILDSVMDKSIGDYTKVNLDFVKEDIIPDTISKLKSNYLYTDKIKQLIIIQTGKIVDEFKSKTLNDILANRADAISQIISQKIDKDKILNTILENSNKLLNKPIKETISIDELNIEYKHYINEIVDGNSLKDIIVHMQSEDIYLAVEGALIKVVVDNLEEILKDNVNEAVKKELAKLPPSQIKDMVEEFMGEELKPINYFGAVLGGGAGMAVGAVSIPVWANPFIYGVVGIATNYLAIKMLFQPYSPLKIGKFKVPFTEGVLPSNKEKMATKMSEFVDEFMLNGTSIQDFFENNSEHLKDFIKTHISQDNYAIIDKLIYQKSNIQELSHESVNLIFNFLDNNQDVISQKIFDIAIEFYDNREKYSNKITDIMYKEIIKREFKEFLYKEYEKNLNQEIPLNFIAQDIYIELDKFIETAFSEIITILSNPTKLRNISIKFDKSFTSFIKNNKLNNLLNNSIKDKISAKANDSITKLFYAEETINDILSFFTKGEFNSSSKLSDMINGMLPKIIEKNLNLIIHDSVLPTLRDNKKLIRKEIMQMVPFGIGWAVKRDVNRTINIILDKEIPQFLDEKIKQINEIVKDILTTQLIDLGYTKDAINQTKVDNLTKSILNNENFATSFSVTMDIFIDNVFNMKIETLLQIFNINKLSDIYDIFEPNISYISKVISKNIKLSEKTILKDIKKLIKDDMLDNILNLLKIKDILKDVDKNLLLQEFEYLEKNLKNSQQFQKTIKDIVSKFTKAFIKYDFLNKEIFKDDLDNFLKAILRDKEQLREILEPFIKEFIININNILDLELKNNMLEIIIDSAFLSINEKIDELMMAIDFKKVITKEIQEMHPKELEDMFYSFAGAYFNKLILYGSLGFIFGLITLIQIGT